MIENLGPHDGVGQMEEADDELVGELIDVSALDLEEILGADDGPLANCIRRLIEQSSREGSAIAGFESFIGGDEPTNVA
jgi:FXSXX-COOH protein